MNSAIRAECESIYNIKYAETVNLNRATESSKDKLKVKAE
jgi:hypothetical protein